MTQDQQAPAKPKRKKKSKRWKDTRLSHQQVLVGYQAWLADRNRRLARYGHVR